MTKTRDDNFITATPLGPSRRGTRRVLAIRAMVGATSWLDGRLRWLDGRVAWEGGALVVPGVGELAQAQRYHNKIMRYPISAGLALGDARAWLDRRQARLELAKRLRPLHAPDLPALAAGARAGDQQALAQLVALLAVEALCLDRLPTSPAAALVACGQPALGSLRALVAEAAAPLAARALAALALGAIERQSAEPHTAAYHRLSATDAWPKRAYHWGLHAGVPEDPALILALLADQDGPALAQRYLQIAIWRGRFSLPADLLRELLAREIPAAQIVALAEAAANAGAQLRRLLEQPAAPAAGFARNPRVAAECSSEQRRQLAAELASLLTAYVRAAPHVETIWSLERFVEAMLGLGRLTPDLAEMLTLPLRRGLAQLPGPMLRPYLQLLAEQHGRLWDRSSLPPNRRRTQRLRGWLTARWGQEVKPLLGLLAATGDAGLAREALEIGIHTLLARYADAGPELCGWLLGLLRLFAGQEDEAHRAIHSQHRLAYALGALLDRCKPAPAARALLQPIVDALMAAPAAQRAELLASLLEELAYHHLAPRDTLPRLTRYLPALSRFAARTRYPYLCWEPLRALLALDATSYQEAPAWFEWMLAHLLKIEAQPTATGSYVGSAGVAGLLAVALADGDLARFQSVFQAALRCRFDKPPEVLARGIATLERFPALRAALGQLFPQQPYRCAELAVRIGLATRLGPAALAPLAELESPRSAAFLVVDPRDADRGWQALLELLPELDATAAAYLHTQWLLGGSHDLPAGVRRAVERPRRLARELAHLERLLLAQPERAELAARAANLRVYLAEPSRLRDIARAEAHERMAQVAAEAVLAAAEQQVIACYRQRLGNIAGPLPAGLCLGDDLLNAALLSLDARYNRRLLRRLLRAHFAGQASWREQHPANAQFLQALAAQGCNVDVWLSALPRTYRCAGVAGERLRLRLEHEPLRILQMGNVVDTCLSFGEANSFSTIANACELNKRVIYATDSTGRVAGRQLIGINAEGKLVGFYTYSSLADEPARDALRAIFARYAANFAARCGLELADQGSVPKLFAEAWYDDGVIPWGNGHARLDRKK